MGSFSESWIWDGRLLKKFLFKSRVAMTFELRCIYISLSRANKLSNKESTVKLLWLIINHKVSLFYMWGNIKAHGQIYWCAIELLVCSLHLRRMSSKLQVDSPPRLKLMPNCHAVLEKKSGRENQNSHWEHFHRATYFLCRICQDDLVVLWGKMMR